MKTDSIFYRIFQYYPASFFELLNLPRITADRYEFTSIEIKQLAFRLDGLFLPKQEGQPFYLLEVQMQPDEELYHRIFAELFLYVRQYRPNYPWRVVVVYPSRSVERLESLQFPEMIALDRVQRFYLDELESETVSLGVIKLIIEPEEQAVEAARCLLTQVEKEVEASFQNAFVELIETIIVYKFPQKTREEIATMLGLGDLTQTRFYQEAFGEGEEIGQQKTNVAAVLRMMKMGFSREIIAQALALPLTEVQKVIEWSDNSSIED